MVKKSLEGILFFHSETGTEGGFWAFQNKDFIKLVQSRCPFVGTKVYDINNPNRQGKILSSEKFKKGEWFSIQKYGVGLQDLIRSNVKWQDEVIEKNLSSKSFLEKTWDYKGLHILENGDNLSIYHPKTKKEVWTGLINLKQYDLFTEHVFGWHIHADQIGIKREVWAEYFFKKYCAKLIPF